MDDRHLVCFLHFKDNEMPEVYIVPITAWKTQNAVLVDREYDKPGQKSKPEWGINYSKKNKHLLEPYKIEHFFRKVSRNSRKGVKEKGFICSS